MTKCPLQSSWERITARNLFLPPELSAIVRLMSRIAAFVLFAITSFGQSCLEYDAPTSIKGRLSLRDEAGYNQFIVLTPNRPVCTIADPKDADHPGQKKVREIQAGVYGDSSADGLRERLDRLIGHRVTVKGSLFPASTGYHRTEVQLKVQSVSPLDTGGEIALRTAKPDILIRDIGAYEVVVNAGRRLLIEAREIGSRSILVPSAQYAPRWMTGGEVLYVKCRQGYALTPLSVDSKAKPLFCDDELGCAFNAFPHEPVIARFRCARED